MNTTNWELMMDVVMSMAFFAPLLIALGLFLFMGALVAFEWVVALGARFAPSAATAHTAADPIGPIATGLQEAVRDEVELQRASTKRPGRAAR